MVTMILHFMLIHQQSVFNVRSQGGLIKEFQMLLFSLYTLYGLSSTRGLSVLDIFVKVIIRAKCSSGGLMRMVYATCYCLIKVKQSLSSDTILLIHFI